MHYEKYMWINYCTIAHSAAQHVWWCCSSSRPDVKLLFMGCVAFLRMTDLFWHAGVNSIVPKVQSGWNAGVWCTFVARWQLPGKLTKVFFDLHNGLHFGWLKWISAVRTIGCGQNSAKHVGVHSPNIWKDYRWTNKLKTRHNCCEGGTRVSTTSASPQLKDLSVHLSFHLTCQAD